MQLADLCPEPLPGGLDLPEEVIIGDGAIKRLPEVIHRFLGERILWVADPDTWQVYEKAANDSWGTIEHEPLHLLPHHPHAAAAAADDLTTKADGMTGLVAVGSGTINDLTKIAAQQRELPYVALATAASMNGYASGIAAILKNGLKTTVPARPPRAIIMDTSILRSAPPEMTQAGLGDLVSVNVSIADWWLSDQLEGSGYNPSPGRLMIPVLQEVMRNAAGLKTGDAVVLEALARGLVLGGVAMVAAATSSPASGGEHLISHLWDMEALIDSRELNLHGTQVGVTTCICSALYQHLLALEHPVFTEPQSWEAEEQRIRLDHGALAEAVLEPARQKHQRAAARVSVLRERWPEIRSDLKAFGLLTPNKVRASLLEAGAGGTLKTLGISRSQASRALRIARDIRDRVTLLDLAFELGFFPEGIDRVLDQAGV